jgi:hypothetical protein
MQRIVQASVGVIRDAEGNERRVAVVGCLGCRGLIIALADLKPMHLNRAEAEVLVECCRAGESSPLARPATLEPKCRVIAQKPTEGGSWMLFFEPDGGLVKFMCSGLGSADPRSSRLAMSRKFLGEFGDFLFTTLSNIAPPAARA